METQPLPGEPAESLIAEPHDEVEVVPTRRPEGHGFNFKVPRSGRLYRLDAARDPHQPRFWCFRISRCASSGIDDATERPWFVGDRMTREDIPAAVEAIRTAPTDWLSLPQYGVLRTWVLEDVPIAALSAAPTAGSARPIGRE